MKYQILNLIKNRADIDYQKFVNTLSSFKANLPQLNENQFDLKILATAAPSCYANIIAKQSDFDRCVATGFPVSNFDNQFVNIGEIKKNNVMGLLAGDNIFEIDTFITDHIDDLPLMKLSRRIIIVKPNKFLKASLKQNGISYEVIF